MPNILIRNVPEDHIFQLDILAKKAGKSRQEFLADLVAKEVGNPEMVLGYAEVFNGEIEPEDDCPECDTPFGNGGIFVGFTPVRSFGPVCRRCATSD